MTLPVSTILFDMDNTLFDLVGAQIAACMAVAGSVGKTDGNALFEEYFLSGRRGFESHENIRDYLSDRNIPADGNYQQARRIYETVKLDTIVPYEGVGSTLAELCKQGFHMGIVTDAHSRDATRRLEKTALLPYFDGIVTFDMVLKKKPAPEPFLCALDMMRAGPDAVLLVGDSPRRDIRPARDLGIRTVYAKYGDRFSARRECPEADFCINKMTELLPIISSLAESGK
ncbi:MAG: HAD family hydrolase [Methanoregula sp.]|jgi:putative hydrolase of the HAD superfamily|nr:HAD family hydrolase [Methanoregula sp.]